MVRPCRPALLRGAVVAGLVAGLLASVAGVTPAPAGAAAEEAPPYEAALMLTIDQLTPGHVPESGPVQVSGTVTNADVVTWEDVTVYPFFDCSASGCGQSPMTTEAELAEAARAEPEAVVGERVLTVEDEVGDIEPGASTTFTLTVPRSEIEGLLTGPGVYWFGVHALGQSESSSRDDVADGRARTFLPYIGPRMADDRSVGAAVVVPLRRRITHLANGAVGRPGLWSRALADDGSLGRLLAFGRAAGAAPVTWLVDPAVPDAVRQLTRGNSGRSLAPTTGPVPGEEGEGNEDGGEGGTGDDEFSDAPDEGDEGTGEDPPEPADPVAQGWLDDLEDELGTGLSGGQVLALPYGDVDLAGAAESDPALYRQSREQTSILDDWGIVSTPALGSPGGYLDANGFLLADDSSLVLLTDRMFGAEQFPDGPPRVGQVGQHRVVVTSYAAGTGGPGPDPRLTGIQLRQRILSEAAVRLLSPDPAPLVVVLPGTVDPASAVDFWSGLDAEWLDLGTVGQVSAGTSEEIELADLTYPDDQEDYELPDYLFDEARQLADAGETLQRMLTRNDSVAGQVRTEALTGASYSSRPDPSGTAAMLSAAQDWIRGRQQAVRISAPPGVTLSSSDGSFAVTVTNRLDQPVTVRIAAESEDGVTIESGDPVELPAKSGPGSPSRTTVVLDVHTDALGVHNVRLAVTDTEGTPLGATAEVPVRSGQVGEIIWWFIGTGVGILFVAIAIRLVRRIRGARTA